MKITFTSNLTPESLQEHAINIGWNDCSALHNGVFYYKTASESARLRVNEDGTGEYSGQRSLLFSHSIFSRLTKAWLDDALEVTSMESTEPNFPAFVYFGDCYMRTLRDEALAKSLEAETNPAVLDCTLRAITGRDELCDVLSFDTGKKVGNFITKEIKNMYLNRFFATE